MLAFIESGKFIYVLAALAGVGIITKLVSAIRCARLERQARDVAAARDSYIRLWKNKFENAYRINKGMNDPDLFVERCMNQCKVLGISLNRWDRLNRTLCSLCLVLGIGAAALEISGGVETALALNHFLAALCASGLMVFVEFACETGEKRQRVELNLEDYFVNTLSYRLQAGTETVTSEIPQPVRPELKEVTGESRAEKKDVFRRDESRRDADRESLRESLERIAASRDPEEDDRRDKRSRSRREEDARLIEEILREYLK